MLGGIPERIESSLGPAAMPGSKEDHQHKGGQGSGRCEQEETAPANLFGQKPRLSGENGAAEGVDAQEQGVFSG